MVSLPSKWAKAFHVEAGDDVELVEQGKNLTITTQKGLHLAKVSVDLTKTDHLLKRLVAAQYLKGCDEIEVRFDTLEKSRIIQKRVDELIGVEVIEQGKDYLLLKDFSGTQENTFDSILRRILHLLRFMSDESLRAFQEKETDLAYVADAEASINKFTDYCFRLLNKKQYPDHARIPCLYTTLFLLELLADEYTHLITYAAQHTMKLSPDFLKIYRHINEYHKNFEHLLLQFTVQDAQALARERDVLVRELQRVQETTKQVKEALFAHRCERIVDIIIQAMGQLLTLS